jgi:hypothetical protein
VARLNLPHDYVCGTCRAKGVKLWRIFGQGRRTARSALWCLRCLFKSHDPDPESPEYGLTVDDFAVDGTWCWSGMRISAIADKTPADYGVPWSELPNEETP